MGSAAEITTTSHGLKRRACTRITTKAIAIASREVRDPVSQTSPRRRISNTM